MDCKVCQYEEWNSLHKPASECGDDAYACMSPEDHHDYVANVPAPAPFIVTAFVGYEYHDEFIYGPTPEVFTIPAEGDVWSFGAAEKAALDIIFAREDAFGESPCARIISITR